MARCIPITVLCLLIVKCLSVTSAIPPLRDNTLETIRQQDVPESENYKGSPKQFGQQKRFLESLQCMDTKTADNKVTVLDGNPNHLNTKVHVACESGKHFSNGLGDNITVTCYPLPHPCMCMAAWQTDVSPFIIYDFNCTAPKVNNDIIEDQSARQCHDPTPINGALTVLSGVPFVISNITVQISCLHGLQFPDGTTTKNETCLPASTPVHVTGVWVPDFGVLTCAGVKVFKFIEQMN